MISFTTLVVLASMVSGQIMRPLKTDVAVKNIDTFHALQEETVDVMILGSSHAWRGVDTMAMYEEYGIAAYNYANNWQHINTTSLFLKDAVLTQSPKVVVIDTVSACNYLENVDINGEVYYTTKISNKADKSTYLKQCFGDKVENYIKYYFPVTAFHDNWSNITKESLTYNTCEKDFNASMGYMYTKKANPTTIKDYTKFTNMEFSEECIGSLDDIVQTCKDNNIELVFITLPWGTKNYKFLGAMEKYAQENDCPYINMFENYEEVGINPATDYYDSQHLNYSGASKVGKFLGQYLKDNYELEDIRNDKDNPWEQSLIKYNEDKKAANVPDGTE